MKAQRSIRRRLTTMSALSSSFALLLACGGFLGYELLGFQASLVNELTTEAEVVAFGLATPLLFDDEVAAESSLQALQATPRIRSAVLTKGGKVFATFGKAKLTPVLPGPPSGGAWHQFERERVLLSVPVLSEGVELGRLTIEASLAERDQRIRQYLLLTALVLVVAWIAALAIAARLQRRILEPILQLTAGARNVSRNADYSVRVETQADEELEVLATTFNSMLATIEEQNANRNHALEALRKSEARFERLLEAGIIGITVSGPGGKLHEANDAFLAIVGYSRDELWAGKVSWAGLTPEEWRPATDEADRQLAESGIAQPFEKEYFRKDGSRVPVLVAAARLDSTTSIWVVLDITERKRLELVRREAFELEGQNRRIQEANRLKSEFLANMSHELRTPLNAILGFGELLQDGLVPAGSPKHREFLGDIVKSGRHLLRLINDVLDLAKVEAGKVVFRPEPIDLLLLVEEVKGIVQGIAMSKRIRLEAEIDPGLRGGILLDPARLKQILYNFISNALKFTPEGGSIQVRALPEGEQYLMIEVEDTGPGIAPGDVERLWVEFQQLDTGPSKQHSGTGLGLALTRRLAEAQGGSVGVRSTPGKGSVFYVRLPRRSLRGVETAPPRLRAAAAAGAPLVLVVEDDVRDHALLVEALSNEGYAVEAATTGAEALALCNTHKFDAITLDLLLPDMSGQEVLRRVRAGGLNSEVPVVVVTIIAEKGVVAGFTVHDFLHKPIDEASLLSSLRRAGLRPEQQGAVLVVDDDESSLKLMAATLTQLGFRAVCVQSGEEALRAAARSPPIAVVLDLLMPRMDGFEFLDRFRESPATHRTPVLIWSVKDLSPEERARLSRSARAIVRKGHAGVQSLLEELRQFLAPEEAER
jgi:PAS domain S-box-containing protein